MSMESAPEARGGGYAGGPTGFRRLTPSLLRADRTAEGFDGLPEGVTVPGQLLAAFKAAAPRLGLSPRLVHAVDWLFRFTQPQDWGRGGRPIVWPSASLQQEALGLSPTQAKALSTMAASHAGRRARAASRRRPVRAVAVRMPSRFSSQAAPALSMPEMSASRLPTSTMAYRRDIGQ